MDKKISDLMYKNNNIFNFLINYLGTIPFNILTSEETIYIILIFSIVKQDLILIKYYIVPICLMISITLIIKSISNRTRPICENLKIKNNICKSYEKNLSFPSGHMVLITGILLPVIIFTKYNIKSKIYKYSLYIILSSIVVFTGIQRISIKYHYTTDVFCGFILGIIFGYIYYMYILYVYTSQCAQGACQRSWISESGFPI